MLGGSWVCSPRENVEKTSIWCVLMFFLDTLLGPPPRPVPSHAICGPTRSGPFLSFLAHYIWGLPQVSLFA